MPTNLPDLSSWHPVPVGATVPAGTVAATVYPDEPVIVGAAAHDTTVLLADHMFTAERIAVPLPTEEGARIIAQLTGEYRRPHELVRRGDLWVGTSGDSCFLAEDLARWAPAPTEWHER